ncbi:hypothetical protein BC830DRAFT_1092962 [Chytriomyces sp. MP71]|nr:hypothetical protein BC830DRAFT_1092962 [Chytriomyces sp. MP71]
MDLQTWNRTSAFPGSSVCENYDYSKERRVRFMKVKFLPTNQPCQHERFTSPNFQEFWKNLKRQCDAHAARSMDVPRFMPPQDILKMEQLPEDEKWARGESSRMTELLYILQKYMAKMGNKISYTMNHEILLVFLQDIRPISQLRRCTLKRTRRKSPPPKHSNKVSRPLPSPHKIVVKTFKSIESGMNLLVIITSGGHSVYE